MSSITVGIDIGTHRVKVVVAERSAHSEKPTPKVISTGSAESRGLHHGYILNPEDAQKSIKEAVRQAERSAGFKIGSCRISIGGVGLSSVVATGKTAIARADMEITENDIKAAHDAAEKEIPTSLALNRKVIHPIPLEYKLDGQPVLGDPNGLKGSNLEVSILFITVLEHHLTSFIEIVENLDIKVIDVIASPVASSLVSLSKTQKIAGCVLVDIGAETTTLAVFENSIPISLEVFPLGGADITNDIALGLQIPLEEAEEIKIGNLTQPDMPIKEIETMIDKRLTDLFNEINSHLKKIKRQEMLPAGIVMTGGTAQLVNIDIKAKQILKLPASVAEISGGYQKYTVADCSWSAAYGLCIIGLSEDVGSRNSHLGKIFKELPVKFGRWFKQFLP